MTDPALGDLWRRALDGDSGPLADRLAADSRLPGPRANLELAHATADAAGTTPPGRTADAVRILDGWLSAPAETDDPRGEYLAAVAALCAGALASDESAALASDGSAGPTGLLTRAASDPRWRVRELAATGLQRVLAADWDRGVAQARAWLGGGPLLVRAATAAVAEPPLLREHAHAVEATAVVRGAVDVLLAVPAGERTRPDVRVLRQALGYAVSVVTAADPDSGVPLLERLATSTDPDARWVARGNLRKARLGPLADRLAVARDAVSRS